MDYRLLGRTGLRVSPLCLGTMNFGPETDEQTSHEIMRDDARAEVAAHLHDSVLQSLVLIQRSDDSRKMAQLARRQERDLRAWLYGAREVGEPTTLHMATTVVSVRQWNRGRFIAASLCSLWRRSSYPICRNRSASES